MGSHFLSLFQVDQARLIAEIAHKLPGLKAGEEPEDVAQVRVFEDICQAISQSTKTIEIYEDEDETPELYDFIWIWGGEGDMKKIPLPSSEYGVPYVNVVGPGHIKEAAKIFAQILAQDPYPYPERMVSPSELKILVDFLEAAAKSPYIVAMKLEY